VRTQRQEAREARVEGGRGESKDSNKTRFTRMRVMRFLVAFAGQAPSTNKRVCAVRARGLTWRTVVTSGERTTPSALWITSITAAVCRHAIPPRSLSRERRESVWRERVERACGPLSVAVAGGVAHAAHWRAHLCNLELFAAGDERAIGPIRCPLYHGLVQHVRPISANRRKLGTPVR
jgi:hypothetical protein